MAKICSTAGAWLKGRILVFTLNAKASSVRDRINLSKSTNDW